MVLMGSNDIENWVREAKDSTITFWNDHVEQPMLFIRDEFFEIIRSNTYDAISRSDKLSSTIDPYSAVPLPWA